MANSPSHKWGQIIGQQFLEVAMEPLLRTIAVKHNLFLDTKGVRSARTGAKICWADLYGNTHDLDFVIERGGTADRVGDPVAFIETAWRRYTKHSRNKAQEIQGAVLPLINTHQRHAPFFGAILAGEWTDGALNQLRSLGFRILHFQYADIIDAFRVVKIDAGFDEDTPDAECAKKVKKWEALRSPARLKVARHLLSVSEDSVSAFLDHLEKAITRQVKLVRVLPLHGSPVEVATLAVAIDCVERHDESLTEARPLVRYEIQIRYSNGDTIAAGFSSKSDTIDFLNSFRPAFLPAQALRQV